MSRLHFPVTTLGPGRRLGLWFQGCSIRCPGCISPDTWAQEISVTEVASLVEYMAAWAGEADGLTVSGGEPFDQPQALAEVLWAWRAMPGTDVLVFSGHPFDAVSPWLEDHPGLIDALVAGPFLKAEPQTLALRGSDNQTLHLLTELGRARFSGYARHAEVGDRKLDVMFDKDGGAWFAGIPARGDFDRLRGVLRSAGHSLILTGDAA